MSRQNSIVVCGGSRLFREGAAALLQAAKFRVLGQYTKLDEMEAKGRVKPADLVLMIGDEAASAGSLAAVGRFKELNPGCHVVMLVGSCVDEERWMAAQSGLDGVLLKSISSQVLCRSLELVLMGEQVFIVNPPAASSSIEQVCEQAEEAEQGPHQQPVKQTAPPPMTHASHLPVPNLTTVVSSRREGLSERELDVLDCLVNGYSNKVIARRCNITEATVKVHLKAILRKISVANRTQAAVWAINTMNMKSSLNHISPAQRATVKTNSDTNLATEPIEEGDRDGGTEDPAQVFNGASVVYHSLRQGPIDTVRNSREASVI